MKTHEFDLLIGGSGEIGGEIIHKLTEQGRNVLFTYHRTTPSAEIYETDRARVIALKLDVRSGQEVQDLADYIQKENIHLRSIIYNTGQTNDVLFHLLSEEDFEEIMDVNLNGCFRVCKALIQNIAINRGCIVLMSSVSGLVGKVGQVNYSCSKAGLLALGRNLACEYAKLGVRVNCLAPGLIQTKLLDKMPEQERKNIQKNIPLQRIGSPTDVANAVNFLVSGASDYITGQTLIIDGGLIMR